MVERPAPTDPFDARALRDIPQGAGATDWRDVPLSAVQHSAVTAWVGVLVGSGLSASTVRHAFRVLSLVLDSAVRDGRLARNPASGVRLPRAAEPDNAVPDR